MLGSILILVAWYKKSKIISRLVLKSSVYMRRYVAAAEHFGTKSNITTEMAERVGPRLRELASGGRRKPGGGIHAT